MLRRIVLLVTLLACSGCGRTETPESNRSAGENTSQLSEKSASSSTNSPGPQPVGYESPEAVFNAFRQAVSDHDYEVAARCLSPEFQQRYIEILAVTLSVVSETQPDRRTEIDRLLNAYGISHNDPNEMLSSEKVPDPAVLIAEVVKYLKSDRGFDDELTAPLTESSLGTLGKVTIDGDSAYAPVTLADDEAVEIDFISINGEWFLDYDDGIDRTTDKKAEGGAFAQSFGDSEWSETKPEPPAPLEAVSREKFPPPLKIKLDVKDRPARSLLFQMAVLHDLGLDVKPALEKTLQQPVSFENFEGSPLEAIEAIARQADVTPVYTASLIEFEPGRRKYPAVAAGPFLIAVTDFETDPETARGTLFLQVFAATLPRTVVNELNDTAEQAIQLAAVTDRNNNDLVRFVLNSTNEFAGPDDEEFDHSIIVDLKNLLRRVESIHRLTGSIGFTVPRNVEVLKFDDLKPGSEQSSGEVSAKLTGIKNGEFSFECEGAEGNDIQIFGFDKEGKWTRETFTSFFTGATSGTITVGYDEPLPARIEIRAVTKREEFVYEFDFPEIPVPNHSRMPERLAELQFEGEAPLTVKFDSLTDENGFPTVRFRATNHSNKGIESIYLDLTWLDANGKELKGEPSPLGEDTPQVVVGRVLPAGRSDLIEAVPGSIPEGTKTVKAVVHSVEFTDATTWQAEDE
jgi:hypothetical protein